MAMFGGGLKALLDPGTALPVAAALMGGQGNQANFANALGALGPAMQQNRTLNFLRQQYPDLAAQVDAGLPLGEAFRMVQEERRLKAQGPSYINAGDGNLFNETTGEWIQAPGAGQNNEVNQRSAAAEQFGLTKDDPRYQSYILTGKMPREDAQPLTATDKKAILEADDMISQNESVIKTLNDAKRLSPTANSGWFAGARASIGNNLPDLMVPDSISSPQSSQDTADMDNAVMGSALTQLKTIFGGNPTEGERAILLELQGSSSKPDHIRQKIFDRAIELAQKRLDLNRQRAQELRGGDFYKPGGGMSNDGWTDLGNSVRIRQIGP